MPVRVYTARISSVDPDVVNVTRKSGNVAFAPSWPLLNWILDLRKDAEDGVITDKAWLLYVARYTTEMRASYKKNRAAWSELLAKERAVICCYCTDAARCHRTLLARDILPKLGAVYAGEIA